VRAYAAQSALGYEGLKFICGCVSHPSAWPRRSRQYSLRHACITLARRGRLPMVQVAARHASLQTTMRSAHDMDSLDTNAVDEVNR
jgi:integrase